MNKSLNHEFEKVKNFKGYNYFKFIMTKFYMRYRGRAYAELKFYFLISQDMMTKKSEIKANFNDFLLKLFLC